MSLRERQLAGLEDIWEEYAQNIRDIALDGSRVVIEAMKSHSRQLDGTFREFLRKHGETGSTS